ncbi:hypothetical protein LWI29_010811 [Acer saccharum]|uniref:Uncharacterized protein n=1 Tax=Acer saccharum TaxID=4024 RepID=A0AA39RVQ6_ACESA|nr:hypothetical protein LWI29_010811 [Acer saccharum]
MAEYLASLSCVKLHLQTTHLKERRCLPRNSHFRAAQRCYHGRYKVVRVSMQKICKFSTSGVESQKVHPRLSETSLRCSCLGFLVNPDGATASDWVPVGDQVLLMASIFLTYLAGVIPVQKSNTTSLKNILDHNVFPESPTSPGSTRKDDGKAKANLKYVWKVVKEKLMESLDTIESESDFGNRILERHQTKRPLSLYAVSEGPKLRLLWASFQQLEKEVNDISCNPDTVTLDDWMTKFSQIIRESCQPICMAWLEKEFCRESSNPDEVLISLIIEKLKGDDTVLQNITKSGKGYLYAELVYLLRFSYLRNGCSYGHNLFVLHAETILEDLVITLADGIASIYLELVSVDGNLSSEINSLGSVMCNLSTRALQKLRNEVALNIWVYQNVEAVVSMYEDRFDLCTLQSQLIEDSSGDLRNVNYSWWKKLILRKSGTVKSALRYIEITRTSISVKRTKELRALTGWRYYFSLCLDHCDGSEIEHWEGPQIDKTDREMGKGTIKWQNRMSRMNKELQSIKDLITGKPGSSHGVSQVMGEIDEGEGQIGQEKEAQAFGEFQRQKNDMYSNTYNPGLKNHPNLSWSNNNHLGVSNNQSGNNYQGANNNQGSSNNPPTDFNSQAPSNQPKDKSLEEIVSTVIKTVGIGFEALKNTLHASKQRMTVYMQSNDQRANSHGASLKKMKTQLAQLLDAVVKQNKRKSPSTDEHINVLEVDEEEVEKVVGP